MDIDNNTGAAIDDNVIDMQSRRKSTKAPRGAQAAKPRKPRAKKIDASPAFGPDVSVAAFHTQVAQHLGNLGDAVADIADAGGQAYNAAADAAASTMSLGKILILGIAAFAVLHILADKGVPVYNGD